MTAPLVFRQFPSLSHRRAILVVVVIAAVLRLATALALPLEYRFTDDAVEYVSVAHHVLEQGIFGEKSGVPYATIPPGYPLFVAAVLWTTGGSLMAVRLVQVGLSTAMVWLLYLIGTRAISKRVGLLAALGLAIYPPWILWPSLFLTETMFTLVVLLLVLPLIQLLRSPSVGQALLVGGVLGAATLVRETLILFPFLLPVLMRWVRLSWRTIGKLMPIVLLSMVTVWTPWLYRNLVTFGVPFFSERTEAIRYKLTGHGYLAPRFRYLADDEAQEPKRKSPDVYRRFGRSSTALLSPQLMVHEPGQYSGYLVRRIQRLWFHPVGLVSVPGGILGKAIYLAAHIVLLLLAAGGLIRGAWRREPGMSGLTVLLLYATAVPIFLVWPAPRYTLPFVPFLFVGASASLTAVAEGFSTRGKRHETHDPAGSGASTP